MHELKDSISVYTIRFDLFIHEEFVHSWLNNSRTQSKQIQLCNFGLNFAKGKHHKKNQK